MLKGQFVQVSMNFFGRKNVEYGNVGGSVVEFSPATRETGVRFPANAQRLGNLSYSFYIPPEDDSEFLLKKIVGNKHLLPCGLVVRIWRFHRHGPGSIPGMGNCLEKFAFFEALAAVKMIFLPQEKPFARLCAEIGNLCNLTQIGKFEC